MLVAGVVVERMARVGDLPGAVLARRRAQQPGLGAAARPEMAAGARDRRPEARARTGAGAHAARVLLEEVDGAVAAVREQRAELRRGGREGDAGGLAGAGRRRRPRRRLAGGAVAA